MIPTTLPGDLTSPTAGPILRRGAPVIEAGVSGMTGAVGICVEMPETPHAPAHLSVWWETVVPSMVTAVTHGTALDLSDPAGMDIAARWLARHHGLTVGATAPRFRYDADFKGYVLEGRDDEIVFNDDGVIRSGAGTTIAVLGISAFTDPAEALCAACLAVVGRTA